VSIAIVTGSAGLIGSEASIYFASLGLQVVGIDNDMRSVFFGAEASTRWNRQRLEKLLGKNYSHNDIDIRDAAAIETLFARYGKDITIVIHTASQPSHDWAAKDPIVDFTVNANGTLNLLEATRHQCPDSVFIFTSTNKVYGDTPNRLPLVEGEQRWEIAPDHAYAQGISEDMSVDHTLHSLFGASKLAADVVVQEYGRYFGMRTACFRGGCLTGPAHSGTELHGFLAYLMKACATGLEYKVYGYKGKQVRDNIHCSDLVRSFHDFFKSPRSGEVYNIGGGRESNCSMLEAIEAAQEITGRKLKWSYQEQNRTGDHIWWISSNARFMSHYPQWKVTKNVTAILNDIYAFNKERWRSQETSNPA
jgi:CDP-paratose 2-epimerase